MYIFGRNAVLEALSTTSALPKERRLEKIFIQFGAEGTAIDTIRKEAQKHAIPCSTMDKRKFQGVERDVCGTNAQGKAQGVLALIASVKTLSVQELIDQSFSVSEQPILIILENINDPHNIGAIARSAECAGVYGIIVPDSKSAPLSGAAMKASAGALEHISVAKTGTIVKAIQDVKNAGFRLLAVEADGEHLYTDAVYDEPTALVIGSEGQGVSRVVRQLCESSVAIPLQGQISSLNASVAAGVVMFEILRQRTHTVATASHNHTHS